MSTSIDQSFVKQFEAEVHVAYQRMGSKLRNTVRNKNNIKGASTTFQKVGKGVASTKSRHGLVPVMNLDHSNVECTLSDHYAGDWVDNLDELKIQHDERKVTTDAGAYALGRKTDELIIAQLDTSTNFALTNGDGMTKAKVLKAFEILGNADIPDDGERYAIVGYRQWTELLGIEEFADADKVGADDLPWKGGKDGGRRWLGTLWMPHSGLTITSDVRLCHWYHKTAIGHASGCDVKSDITWHGDRAAHFVNNMMSQGSVMIDALGVVTMRCLES